MSGVSEPPLVPPVPPDLFFLVPPESSVPLAPSCPVVKDTIMTEASDKNVVSSPRVDASPNQVAPSSGLSAPVAASATIVTAPMDENQLGVSSTPPSEGKTKDSTTQSSEFNWLSRTKATRKFPQSDIPVTQSDEGVPRVKIPNGVFERGAKAHSDFIVGIFYGNAPSYGKIWGVLNYLWGRDKRVTIHNLSKNAYLFHIPSVALRQRILQHELWRVGDSPFFVTEWKASFSIDPPSLQRAPIWATLNKVPFDLLTDEGLVIITKPLGKIVDAKPFSSVSSVDVKVVVDLTVKLPEMVEIERENGLVDVLEVTYAWLPPLCPVCKEIGHKANFCPTIKPQSEHQTKNGAKSGVSKSGKSKKSTGKATDKSKTAVTGKQKLREDQTPEQTVPVKSCLKSVLTDLDSSARASLVFQKVAPSCSVATHSGDLNHVEASFTKLASVGIDASPQDNLQSLSEVHQAPSSETQLQSSLLVPDPTAPDQETPFLPAVKAVSFKAADVSNQKNLEVVSFNPFAVLEQDEDPSSLQDDSTLSLVVSVPVNNQPIQSEPVNNQSAATVTVMNQSDQNVIKNNQSTPSPVLSRNQKSKKRKLAKRSPVSGGSPPLILGDRNLH
ncbi:hypothetical protein Rs2_29173 [Raphanus sativus]|nr:hypothetical protein Rs2_29173 [Raphanus sativus]